MNGTDRDYFDVKLAQIDRRLKVIHDDVLIIKTERKMEKKLVAAVAAVISLAISILAGIFWR